jgi:serine/threonine protein kinase
MKENTTNIVLAPSTVLSGEYQIIRLIGQGGMGAVYMAYDTRLDLKVAIKVISPGVVEAMEASEYELALKRFQAEARIVASVDHPNVIRIFGFKQDTIECDGQNIKVDYLVMELMAERTLRDTMDESGFEFEEEIRSWLTQYMIPILEGLEKVHEKGIIHRDIKPENIFLKDNNAKLADFGLSMGSDFPSVTGSMVEIFGTLAYMAPEQYNNFSMARESADIFAIGRLLFEVVEGKITEKVTPFTQVQLTDTGTEYSKALSHIVMEATAENTMDRIGSIKELKKQLIDIHQCPFIVPLVSEPVQKPKSLVRSLWLLLIIAVLSLSVFAVQMLVTSKPVIVTEPQKTVEITQNTEHQVAFGIFPTGLKKKIQADDNSILRLVPPAEIELLPENPFGKDQVKVEAFYLAENPITNDQYVVFLNSILDRVQYEDNNVLVDGQLVLKLSEKIRGYKPILFDGKSFSVQHPMHSSCAVLMVTGYGAAVYADHYGFRLPKAQEWFAVMTSNGNNDITHLPLPTPVINYPQEKFGIRGINHIAEWGKSVENDYLILGQSVSTMVGNTVILKKNPSKYYTDTSFRLVKDVTQ